MTRKFICFAAVLVLAGCGKKTADTADAGDAAVPVQVTAATKGPIRQLITAEAVLFPLQQADIMPKVSAPVQRFFVQRGDHVKAGEMVANLEDRDLAAAAQESKEAYLQAQTAYQTTTQTTALEDLTKAQTDAVTAQQTLEAAKRVYDSRVELLAQGAIARKLVDDAKVALVQAQSQADTTEQNLKLLKRIGQPEQLKGAQAQLAAAKAHYMAAAAQVGYSEIRSPISGVVSDRPVNIGSMASSGSALMTIIDVSEMVARANLPVSAAAAVRVGQKATISSGGVEAQGKVKLVSPSVDPNTTTVQVWIQARNPGERLKLGTTASVSIDAGEIKDATVVPATALLSSDEGGDKVMVAGSDSLAHETPVKVGVRDGDNVQILSGVKPGDKVIVSGALGLDDKAKIAVGKDGGKDAD